MSTVQEALSSLFGQLASLVKKMSDEELKMLTEGDVTIDLVKKDESRKPINRAKDSFLRRSEIEPIVSQLRSMDEREQGVALLSKLHLNKASLELVARHIDLPVTQRDNMETLREKIIEATIGYRLRSMAIQGRTDPQFSTRGGTEDTA